jgi:hypothetical protein
VHRTYAQTTCRCQCARRVSACVILFHVLYVSRTDAHFVDALCVFARDGGFLYSIFAPLGVVFLNDALCVSWCSLNFECCSVMKSM